MTGLHDQGVRCDARALRASTRTDSPCDAIRGLFEERIVVATAIPSHDPGRVYEDELRHVAGAVVARRSEFLTARTLARQALGRLGFPPEALVPHPDRAPRWPNGARGTITHTKGLCAVAVTNAPDIRGLGLDVEWVEPLKQDLIGTVCTHAEQAELQRLDESARGLALLRVFCAKEAFYKCQYPLTTQALDFVDISVKFDPVARRFAVGSRVESIRRLLCRHRLVGRFAIAGPYVFAGATLYAPPTAREGR